MLGKACPLFALCSPGLGCSCPKDFRILAYALKPFSTMSQFSRLSDDEILKKIQSIIPPLTYEQHKGQSGCIGIIGGSEEYTGAPYFAAISALKLGADLAHVFCSRSAAPVIKSYSPELIVHPFLSDDEASDQMKEWIPRLHAVVIGPGLGRNPKIFKTVLSIMEELKKQEKPLVIDADGLFMITNNLEAVKEYKNVILTPNQVEFERLCHAVGCDTNSDIDEKQLTLSVSKLLGGLVIARKHRHDIITDGVDVLEVKANGSPRRCGGQGDLLSGAAAVFFHWSLKTSFGQKSREVSGSHPGVLGGYAACLLSKLCAESAFGKYGRSTTTTDLINEIHFIFQKHFEKHTQKL
uniref:ATP-dependent (S)-NAD(P)H-hydrate dehydratase-like n=1 Tax=Styela clava TaxID=7725 RepID=UPI00193A8C37|nr:ATP-dependent (S)-NAD(P)H-hydrate dehydratase-like [Styela clava]